MVVFFFYLRLLVIIMKEIISKIVIDDVKYKKSYANS